VPALTDAPIQRSWIAPVAFTPDQQAMLGPAPGCDNLYICTGFKSALIIAPVGCELLARQMIAAGLVG
jgi:glycine/D-amino acid oxidase-like deaminating enzyme